jgi:hypothetical protein
MVAAVSTATQNKRAVAIGSAAGSAIGSAIDCLFSSLGETVTANGVGEQAFKADFTICGARAIRDGAIGAVGGALAGKALGLVGRGGGKIFERVVSTPELKATLKSGLLRGGRPGQNFFTNSASLNAKRAQIRLGLDGALRSHRIRFRIKKSSGITGPGTAKPGRTGTPGGGREFSTHGPTQIEILDIRPLRK